MLTLQTSRNIMCTLVAIVVILRSLECIWCGIELVSQVLISKSLEVYLCNLNRGDHGSWDLPLHLGFQVLNPKYAMDAHMMTFFGAEVWKLCGDLGRAKVGSNSQQILRFFA
jgi:hypothetical protein